MQLLEVLREINSLSMPTIYGRELNSRVKQKLVFLHNTGLDVVRLGSSSPHGLSTREQTEFFTDLMTAYFVPSQLGKSSKLNSIVGGLLVVPDLHKYIEKSFSDRYLPKF